ncbi:MAG: hypothetical protein AAF797_18130, partial [Planctomycetota bacterium]
MAKAKQERAAKRGKWRKRFAVTAAVLVVLYLLGGFIGVPVLIRYVALPMVQDRVNGTVTLADSDCNPLVLSLTLEGFEVLQTDGAVAARFDRLYVNASLLKSVWNWGAWLDAVELDQPYGLVRINDDGSINLESLQKAPPA